jgi:hypothetical protein
MFKLMLINQPDVIMYTAIGTVSLSISIRLARSWRARRQESGAVISATEARPTEGRYSLKRTCGTTSKLLSSSHSSSSSFSILLFKLLRFLIRSLLLVPHFSLSTCHLYTRTSLSAIPLLLPIIQTARLTT